MTAWRRDRPIHTTRSSQMAGAPSPPRRRHKPHAPPTTLFRRCFKNAAPAIAGLPNSTPAPINRAPHPWASTQLRRSSGSKARGLRAGPVALRRCKARALYRPPGDFSTFASQSYHGSTEEASTRSATRAGGQPEGPARRRAAVFVAVMTERCKRTRHRLFM